MSPGETSDSKLISNIKEGLIVEQVLGVGAGQSNQVTSRRIFCQFGFRL
ncbi:hypothetical protein ACP6PL_28510 [Dapis sp. BLCC M126]